MNNNTGEENTGNYNSGNYNSGDWNSGYCNSGNYNSGDWNSGNYNSGDYNSGDYNSGNRNSGNCNSGNRNSGDYNSGDYNSGDYNSGNCNSGNRNSGYFNTGSPNKIQIFNEWVEMTHEEFHEKNNIYMNIPLNRWIDEEDMTKEEKKEIKGWAEMGGYLKTLPFKEACVIWWEENPKRHKDFLELPNFNADIFKEITGIDVEQKDDKMEEAMNLLKKKGFKIIKDKEA